MKFDMLMRLCGLMNLIFVTFFLQLIVTKQNLLRWFYSKTNKQNKAKSKPKQETKNPEKQKQYLLMSTQFCQASYDDRHCSLF